MPVPIVVGAAAAIAARLAAKKVAQEAAKKAAVRASTKAAAKKTVGTKEAVGRALRKKAEPKLTPKDPALQAPASGAEVIKKERYLKDLASRPVTKNRAIPRRSSQSLTPNEKRYVDLGKKARVTVTRKKPMSLAEIKTANAAARKEKFKEVLTPDKPIGEKRPGRVTSKRLKRTPRELPSHKVDVKIMRKKNEKPDTSNAGAEPDRVPLYSVGKKVKTARVSQPYKSRAEMNELNANAKANPKNWDVADQRRPSNIAEGRGQTVQPPSVTTQRVLRTKEEKLERRLARRATRRDLRTDARESKSPGFERLQPVKRGVPKNAEQRAEARANRDQRIKYSERSKKGTRSSKRSTTNHPKNKQSDRLVMESRLKEINEKIPMESQQKPLYQGLNKVSPELKNKVNKTLGNTKKTKKRLQLQNTYNPPKFSRNAAGKVKATNPIKPKLKPKLSKTRPTKGK